MKDNCMIHIRLTPEMHKQVKLQCVLQDKSINLLVGSILEDYLGKKKGLV